MSWLRGIVKEVPSGDCLTIVGATNAVVKPEKRLTLSSIVAPKLAKRDGTTKDEPFAWQSRETLRKKLIGQPVVFRVDYTVEQLGNREFGTVFLGTTNVAEAMLAAGMAKVKTVGTQQSPYLEALKAAEEKAQLAGLGVWTKDPLVSAEAVRNVQPADAFNASTYLQMNGKGSEVQAVIEAVSSAGTLRATLLPDFSLATIMLCGVQAPSMGRRAPAASSAPTDAAAAAPTQVSPAEAAAAAAMGVPTPTAAAPSTPSGGPSAASIAGTSNAEPFAVEAKALTEARALNRDVRLVLEGVDKYNNLFATVFVPAAPAPTANGAAAPAPAAEESLAELLVRAGYAKCAEWSLNMMCNGSQRLRDLEKAAKTQRVGIWTNYVPPPTNQTKLSDSFNGKVVEIVSADCLVVKDASSGVERRLQLSSIRAPRMATRERPADPHAAEAREFLRKRLIGREVSVKMEYTRKVELITNPGDERILSFGNVEVVPEKGEEKQNVAELVVARGYATVIKHRGEEERSCIYERLMEVENMARNAKRGIHSPKEPPANRINDMSAPGQASKAKQYLPFFQRNGKMQGLVEFVLSGHRLKVTIPKEGVTVVFAPSGIKTPQRAQPAAPGKPAVQGEPYAEEALAFTREHVLQRECEVSIDTMDRGGTFLGTINILPTHPQAKPLNLPLALLRMGLAKLQPIDPARLPGGSELVEAQRAAKEARLRIWEKWTPEMDRAEEEEEQAQGPVPAGASAPKEVLNVVVTEVVDASEFYVQRTDEPRVAWVAEQVAAATQCEGPAIPPQFKVPSLCLAQYSLDKQWYRAYLERKDPFSDSYHVFFIDYGNREKVPDKCLRPIDSVLAAVPPQALLCSLAYIKVPMGASEHAGEAKAMLAQLLGSGQPMVATVVAKERPAAKDDARHPRWQGGGGFKRVVTLQEADTQADVAVELLCAGLARLPSQRRAPPAVKEAVAAYAPYQDEARTARRGIFMYGDPGDSEDEDAPKPAAGAWGKPR